MAYSSGFHKKYTLLGTELGRGAYATVELAKENTTGSTFAVKIYRKNKVKDNQKKKFAREMDNLIKVNHENIVRVFGCYDEGDRILIVMEYVDGGSLDEVRSFGEKQVIEYINQILKALQHCKSLGLMHRDLKPANILLTKDGKIKVADFNLSKMINPKDLDDVMLHTHCGSPNFMAPEIAAGANYNFKCDVWSIGVVAFFLLSGGHYPFKPTDEKKGKELRSLVNNIIKAEYSFSPAPLWEGVTDQSKDFIKNCLQKDISQRWGYEQLLGHPWFKLSTENLKLIDITVIRVKNAKKRELLSAAFATAAARTFEEFMGKKENNLMLSGSAIFDLSVSQLNLS